MVPLDLTDVSATTVHRDLTHASPADESRTIRKSMEVWINFLFADQPPTGLQLISSRSNLNLMSPSGITSDGRKTE